MQKVNANKSDRSNSETHSEFALDSNHPVQEPIIELRLPASAILSLLNRGGGAKREAEKEDAPKGPYLAHTNICRNIRHL